MCIYRAYGVDRGLIRSCEDIWGTKKRAKSLAAACESQVPACDFRCVSNNGAHYMLRCLSRGVPGPRFLGDEKLRWSNVSTRGLRFSSQPIVRLRVLFSPL